MAKKIVVDIDYLEEALVELEKYKKEIEYNAEELCHQLALVAMDEAESRYGAMGEEVAGDIVVNLPEKIENGYRVTAHGTHVVAKDGTPGNTIVFAEFGAGTAAGDGHPHAGEFQAFPGTWSVHDARQWTSRGYWYFDGRRYDSIAPSRAMYYAFDLARRRTAEVAWEVFR